MTGASFRPGRKLRFFLGLSLLGIVSGCSMFHSNIRGGFACAAPDGSCAPTTVIDDGALRSIQDNPTSGDLPLPAASDEPKPAQDEMVSAKQVVKDPRLAASLAGRALRIVFPAHTISDGQVVPKRIAYARVDLADWVGFQNEPTFSVDGKISTKLSKGLFGAAVNAPELLASGSASNQPTDVASAAPVPPAATNVAAQAGNGGTAWVDQVKADAARVLKDAKGMKTAGTFSPDGK